ncbi:putative f-box protein pp2-b12, partial [Quercus suber]
SFFLDKLSGKKCYLLCTRDQCIIWGDPPLYWTKLVLALLFVIGYKISTSMLSLKTNYAVYLVFKLRRGTTGFGSCCPLNASIKTTQGGEDPRLRRKDGWSETKMGEFFNEGGKKDELEIRLMDIESGRWKFGLIFEGIEIRPIPENIPMCFVISI